MTPARVLHPVLVGATLLALAPTAHADPASWPTLGGEEGTFDVDTSFSGLLGYARPGVPDATWQPADTRLATIGIGYSAGNIGPLHDCYARIEGGLFQSALEQVRSEEDALPVGYRFHAADRGGLVRGTVAANLVTKNRYAFGLFLQSTLPLQVDLAKFSSVRVHLVGGGTRLDVALTDPEALLRLKYRARFFVGSGAYDADRQHNAQIQFTNLLRLESARWLLPWPAGLALGPHVEADLNSHRNAAYADAYGAVLPMLGVGEKVQTASVALAVMPYFHVTNRVAVEVGYQQVLVGYQIQGSRTWSGSLRTTF